MCNLQNREEKTGKNKTSNLSIWKSHLGALTIQNTKSSPNMKS